MSTPQNSAARFGTFAGVFTPNVLTILGLILFLRIGYVTAYAGLWHTLLIVAIANAISLLTGLSLSAISTSMEVKAGGDYYMISRSLGLEIGGAIGIPLYLSQAISVAFYIIGFTESLQSIALFAGYDARFISVAVVALFIVIAWIGADFALKIQFGILAVLVSALISFFAGGWTTIAEPILEPAYADGITFWVAFAIFFPAVTGINVGTSMSGDLKDPNTSIPRGTIASIVVTSIIYFAVVIWFAFHAPNRQLLIEDSMYIQQISLIPALILAGVWASTLSSALGSIVAAPRTLQAISKDTVLPKWMSSNLGHATEPRMAVLVTGTIALVVIMLGDLNAVAPIIAMFFLNTYGITNFAAGIEKLVGNPSYRPRFNIAWYWSILGAISCYVTMFLIDATATVFAIVTSIAIYIYIQRKSLTRTWGDVRSGMWFALARYALLHLEEKPLAAKNWRPNLMVFIGQPSRRLPLAEVAKWLSQGKGIVTFFHLIVRSVSGGESAQQLRDTAIKNIKGFIKDHRLNAFAEAEVMPDYHSGVTTIAQAHGIGRLESNTILQGWSGTSQGRVAQFKLLRDLDRLDKSAVFLRYCEDHKFGKYKTINVWWRSKGPNASLMLLLGHLIKQNQEWRNAELNLIRVVGSEHAVESTQTAMAAELKRIRVQATPQILVNAEKRPVSEIIQERSRTADLTLIGMDLPDEENFETYSESLNQLVDSVGSVLIVRSAIPADSFME